MLKHGSTIDEQEVEVSSSKISFRLTVNNTPAVAANGSATALSPQLITPEVKTYKVGDYYNDGKKEGVVFWVTDGGKHGKILSLTELWCQWTSDDYEQKRLIGADARNNGSKNMAVVKQIPGWETKYPAFKKCADMGDGWYLPAVEELKTFILNEHVNNAVNRTLTEHSGTEVKQWYWSSTEYGYCRKRGCAWGVNMRDHYNNINLFYKSNYYYVRAVSAF